MSTSRISDRLTLVRKSATLPTGNSNRWPVALDEEGAFPDQRKGQNFSMSADLFKNPLHAPPMNPSARPFDARELLSRFGPLMQSRDLWRVLCYPSSRAFTMARRRNTVPVRLFTLPLRRGVFAFTEDVALWLEVTRRSASQPPSSGASGQADGCGT